MDHNDWLAWRYEQLIEKDAYSVTERAAKWHVYRITEGFDLLNAVLDADELREIIKTLNPYSGSHSGLNPNITHEMRKCKAEKSQRQYEAVQQELRRLLNLWMWKLQKHEREVEA
jgi:hypothetical protein